MNTGTAIAYFVTPHGFGHAGRAAAVMAALREVDPSLAFHVFTKVPEWFFRESVPGPLEYHPYLTDIGLVQASPLREDIPATVARLDEFLPFDAPRLDALADAVTRAACTLIVSDIAPLGIAVAKAARIPSVLVENFTWDWIYEGYADVDGRMSEYARYLSGVFQSADYRVQTEPVTVYQRSDLLTMPVSRRTRESASVVREKLRLPRQDKAVLVTMGGMETRHNFLGRLKDRSGVCFVIPGSSDSLRRDGNLLLLPHHSDFFHPDLINACDAVIGKLGYSTVAEVYSAGVPFGYVPRPQFRESEALAEFARAQMNGVEIPEDQFEVGRWLDKLDEVLAHPRIKRIEPNGAQQVAQFLSGLLMRTGRGESAVQS